MSRTVSFNRATDAYCDFLNAQNRYSTRTVGNYRSDLRAIARSLEELQVSDWSGVNSYNLRMVIADQHASGLSASTVARRLSSLRTFFNYLIREKHIKVNPVSDVSAPKDKRKAAEVLQVEDIRQLLLLETDDILLLRDRALFEIMYSCALRLSEAANLDIDSIDTHRTRLKVNARRHKFREFPLGKPAMSALKQYLCRRSELLRGNTNEPALFVSKRGGRLSSRSIQQRLKNLAMRMGLDQNLYPHLLRLSLASHLLESSGDYCAVREFLGSGVSTRQQAVSNNDQLIFAAYESAHPRAKKI